MIGMIAALLFMICLVEQSGVRRRGGMAAVTCGFSWICVTVGAGASCTDVEVWY